MLIRLIIIFLGLLTYFFYIYYYTSIIKYYTPVHVIFAFPIQYFIEKNILLIFTAIFFNDMLFNGDNLGYRFLADVSGDIGSIIGFLIYLEIIELNFCKLNYDLKKNITKRGEIDYNDSVFPSRSIVLNNLKSDIYIDEKRTDSNQYQDYDFNI